VKGIAFLGAIQILEQYGVLKRCRRFAGSSAGAITAGLLAAGYNDITVLETLLSKNWCVIIRERRLTKSGWTSFQKAKFHRSRLYTVNGAFTLGIHSFHGLGVC